MSPEQEKKFEERLIQISNELRKNAKRKFTGQIAVTIYMSQGSTSQVSFETRQNLKMP